ncbi:dnaJ-related protein SCJ1-like isoform X1 [Typha angustifolia]|uniref:dnaJ-related protein SCJ1-like isoform X1 n=1 Tax=Typha angustifolia TaxID=59011 RepID=UPI003C2F84D4
MWWEWYEGLEEEEDDREEDDSPVDFDFLSLVSKPKVLDYYKILEVDYDATEETIRSNYIRLALKWHPDKKKGEECATSRFQEINEAYQVLSNPVKKREYDRKGTVHIQDHNVIDYLNRHKGLILTCNGLGIRYSIW